MPRALLVASLAAFAESFAPLRLAPLRRAPTVHALSDDSRRDVFKAAGSLALGVAAAAVPSVALAEGEVSSGNDFEVLFKVQLSDTKDGEVVFKVTSSPTSSTTES